MVTSILFIAFIGTLQFNSAISAAIDYEPIKITVNENFNALPGQVSTELQEPAVVQQGANFYFKPQLNLSPNYIPSHIEALMSLIQQHYDACATDTSKLAVEKEKLVQILKPFMYPLPDISKETLSEIVLEKENNLETVKPIIITEEPKPATPELLVIPEAPVLPPLSFNSIPPIVEHVVKKEKSVILDESTGVLPERTIIEVEPKPAIQKLTAIPEPPVLPSLSLHDISSIIEEEVKKEESIILEEQTSAFPTIPERDVRPSMEPIINYIETITINSDLVHIPEAPVLPLLSLNGIGPIVEGEMKKEKSIILEESTGVLPERTIIEVDPKPVIQKLTAIPEPPVLPSLSLHDISSIIEEEVKKEESIILEEQTSAFPTIPERDVRPIMEPIINYTETKPITSDLVGIPEAPVLPPLSLNGMQPIVEGEMKKEESIILEESTGVLPKPTIIKVDPKPVIQKLTAIPEPPVLPSLSLNDISSIIEEEVKKEESIILEEQTGVFPTIPEIDVRPIMEPIINYTETKPITSDLVDIPEAPVLAPISLNGIRPIVEGEMNKEKSIILEESTDVLPERTIIEVEPKLVIQELAAISEAPVLPSLSLHDISSIIEEEVKKEESIILEEQTGVFPTIPERDVRPSLEPIINYIETKSITSDLVDIPEAPVPPPLSLNGIRPTVEGEMKKEASIILEESTGVLPERTIIEVDPKPVIQKLTAIPEPPVLPSLSLHDISSIIEEEVKKEESIILEEQTSAFPTIPERDVRPSTEPIINHIESKPITSDLVDIPEAPVLPPLSLNGIGPIVEGEMKKEESIILEESTGVLPERTLIEVDPKPVIQKLAAIPEPPVLPSLSHHDISSIIKEEVKKEESIILEEQTGVFPTIPEIDGRPIMEPIINYTETKPITSDLVDIPEAPVLAPISLNGIRPIVEGEMNKEKSIILEESTDVLPERTIIEVEPKLVIQELAAIPEAPVLPSLSLHDISFIIEEEVKKEESIILEEQTGVFPTIPERDVKPSLEPIINYIETKSITSDLVDIPEAPVLPPLSLNGIRPTVEGEMKKEASIILEGSTDVLTEPEVDPKPVIQKLTAIPEPPVLPSLSLHDISSIIEEEVKKEESIILEEQTSAFPTIPEIDVRPNTEPIINYFETKPITSEHVIIPEAPVLPQLSFNGIPHIAKEEVKKEESIILEDSTGVLPEPTIIEGEPKLISSAPLVIPEAPSLPPLSLNGITPVAEEELKKEKGIILEGPAPVFPTIPNQVVSSIPEPIINYIETKPITPKLVVIPEALVLSSLSYNGITPAVEEVKIEESNKFAESTGVFPSISEISARPLPEPSVVLETLDSFALENNIFPITTEEVKLEVPILFDESTEVFPPIAEISSGPTLDESEITDSYVLEEVSQPNPENAVALKEILPPTIIPKSSNNLEVFSYVPFVSHLSNHAPKTKKHIIPKPASLERFLLKKHPFRLPLTPFPKLDLNEIKSSLRGKEKQFLYPTSYAHDVVEKRIAPNMAFKKQNAPKRVKIYIRSNVPKGPSYL